MRKISQTPQAAQEAFAALEWLQHCAYYAADVDVIDVNSWSRCHILCIDLSPCVCIISGEFCCCTDLFGASK